MLYGYTLVLFSWNHIILVKPFACVYQFLHTTRNFTQDNEPSHFKTEPWHEEAVEASCAEQLHRKTQQSNFVGFAEDLTVGQEIRLYLFWALNAYNSRLNEFAQAHFRLFSMVEKKLYCGAFASCFSNWA
ncbi:unnamed protein product [Cylindrotheca closterium]|uniref:Uncharacterized protein n=1 Tax=Cylindrotheca closterium TaxID=2856 RepID=A0AAD2PXQ2_9STRA|nr:unnamed protein product [Cylindrotheca closterium]